MSVIRRAVSVWLVMGLGMAAANRAALAELLVYEPFAGAAGQKLDRVPPWQPAAAATDRLELGTGSLPIPTGVQVATPREGHAFVRQTVTAQVPPVYRSFRRVTRGTLYVSLLLRHEKPEVCTWAGINVTDGVGEPPRSGLPPYGGRSIYLGKQSTAQDGQRCILEVVPNGGQGAFAEPWQANVTRFLVLKVDLDAKRASCFVNPVCGQPEPAQAQATADLTAGPQPWQGQGLDTLFLECGSWKAGTDADHLIGRVEFDELRIGTTWADVTPARRPLANRGTSPEGP